ncbi:hypothetical protein L484_024080 [Morus notabilis]|uniref:Uncharacterized protein n=1 Tax=Morus notabilis TaxID=981085 RepID=W9S0H4_9ROSA|nr:hypothetical protein L484_024080 [Morus notabilis]
MQKVGRDVILRSLDREKISESTSASRASSTADHRRCKSNFTSRRKTNHRFFFSKRDKANADLFLQKKSSRIGKP